MVTVLLLLGQLLAGAWAGGRPPDCAPLDARGPQSRWDRARTSRLADYCILLARANAKLASRVSGAPDALVIAHEAARLEPARGAAYAVEGRALTALGRESEALASFGRAQSHDARALDEPATLAAWARALARTGHRQPALEAYRALLPRAAPLPLEARTAAALEAGMLAMGLGPSGLDEAIAFFRQAVRDSHDEGQKVARLALALALDRSELPSEALPVLAERAPSDARALLGRTTELLGPIGMQEQHALVAVALSNVNPPGAREAWRRYLLEVGTGGVWSAHARAHWSQHATPVRASHWGRP